MELYYLVRHSYAPEIIGLIIAICLVIGAIYLLPYFEGMNKRRREKNQK